MCFSPSSLSTVCHERPSEFRGSRQQRVRPLLCIHIVKHNKFWRQQVENQTMWYEGGAGVWSPPADETAGSLKCTAAQLHISFDCQFVVCAARCFELPLKMKANLVQCVHCRPLLLLICFRRHQGLGDYYLFPSIDLNHAGLSIMYNLSYNTSQDTTPSQLHFNLIPFFSPLYEYGQCMILQRWAFVVSSRYALIFSGSRGENHTT